jgi:threonine aldolase
MYHDTAKGLEQLLDIMPVAVGDRAPFTVEDLSAVAEHPAVVAVELPLRRSGFLLPEWSQLEAVSRWARGAGAAFHIDGARLWEASAGYERSLADIAALADSVYVSFYKGIGGMAGAMVAGDSEFIERLKPWRIRFGARLQTSFPIALAALSGIKKHLPKQTGYLTRAHALAGALNSAGFSCAPTPPHISSFRVFFDGEPATLRRAHEQFARETGVWLFDDMFQLPGEPAFGEIVIGDAAEDYADDEAVEWLSRFSAVARRFS